MQLHTGKLKFDMYYQNTLNFISLGTKLIPANELLAKLETKLKCFSTLYLVLLFSC